MKVLIWFIVGGFVGYGIGRIIADKLRDYLSKKEIDKLRQDTRD